MSIGSMLRRLKAIEDRQRAYGMHDPGCSQLLHEQAQAKSDMWFGDLPDCNCWLSQPDRP